ncbi:MULTISPECIES: sugar phosphate nucleotidyltransferase [unclassified Moorena]|uniref:sugar phosphate nucleotidyltransferase n=1 Tax=unclassified Moorena TaxID=2683338 RepID=UPI0013C1B71F|nr:MULTISPECIES: sugar phosphate nucleotidyltransferase [unclassified Moorena]NEO05753.1 NTP transferase domain-containing protein [Moorena sp. SIO3I8]NEO22863.1 NTP transferase domain-containing protein [Moorena sp. SIO4A5]NEP25076.1 NTP transferase domain-containing protein [Moorena sp. SIO3I6]NEQ61685.1 NTP transferase domain-containing protein [Moorena sp. SIO4A1]
MFDQAVILAGGRGTRLAPLTDTLPKVMAPVEEHPFLEYQIQYLQRQGIRSILLLLGYRWEQVKDYFGNGHKWNVEIEYSVETMPLGTAGCLSNAYEKLNDVFVVVYGDSFLPCDYSLMFQHSQQYDQTAIMTIYPNQGELPVPNNVRVSPDGFLQQYIKDRPDLKLEYVDAGALVLHLNHIDNFPNKIPASLEEDIFPDFASAGTMQTFMSKHRFYDIGTPSRLDQFRQDFSQFF